MAARQRDSVQRSASSESQMTFRRFIELFPGNDACLEYLKQRYYPDGHECPKCRKATKYHRVRGRAAYSCQWCGHHVYPTAGTIFHKSTTSLHLWFWAIFLMSSTRCGISAKQLEREIGVTYKTAWRMFHQIRKLLREDIEPLTGEVEADETMVGGKPRQGDIERLRKPGETDLSAAGGRWKDTKKATVFGMVERGGRVKAVVVKDRKADTLQGRVAEFVLPGSTVFTDEWPAYHGLDRRYRHRRIAHSQKVYVMGDCHTQCIEGFFGLVKTGIRGVYHSVSAKYLQMYFDEYSFRYNRRKGSPGYEPIFWAILDRVQKREALASS